MAAAATTSFPPIRACIFDMDGLLINSEDKLTLSMNELLVKYGRPPLTGAIRARLMGVPNSSNGDIFHEWARLPISRTAFARESSQNMRLHFPDCLPLPGAEQLLSNLSRATTTPAPSSSSRPVGMALASSTTAEMFALKTTRPETARLLGHFPPDRRILGDDPRLAPGRGKPAPDIFLLALRSLNDAAEAEVEAQIAADFGTRHIHRPILPSECLVFEDSVVGVEAARRAGMRVVWVPHPDLAVEYEPVHREVLAGRTGMVKLADGDDSEPGEIDDGWAETIPSLEHFDYEKYGIQIPH